MPPFSKTNRAGRGQLLKRMKRFPQLDLRHKSELQGVHYLPGKPPTAPELDEVGILGVSFLKAAIDLSLVISEAGVFPTIACRGDDSPTTPSEREESQTRKCRTRSRKILHSSFSLTSSNKKEWLCWDWGRGWAAMEHGSSTAAHQ